MTDRTEQLEPVAGSRFTAMTYEPFLWLGERRGMRENRRRLLADARGKVLEIGTGTGLNVGHYPAAAEELTLAEPVPEMAERIDLEAWRRGHDGPGSVTIARAEELPFADGSFDTVVSTMVLCTVSDPGLAIDEIRRVLRPGGSFLFCEHVRSDSARLARWQDRLAGPWAAFADGCRCDRATHEAIGARLEITRLERETWRGMPPLVHPLAIGEAVTAA